MKSKDGTWELVENIQNLYLYFNI